MSLIFLVYRVSNLIAWLRRNESKENRFACFVNGHGHGACAASGIIGPVAVEADVDGVGLGLEAVGAEVGIP